MDVNTPRGLSSGRLPGASRAESGPAGRSQGQEGGVRAGPDPSDTVLNDDKAPLLFCLSFI